MCKYATRDERRLMANGEDEEDDNAEDDVERNG